MSLVFLAQTDTTVGFLCKDPKKLNQIKNRPFDTPCIKVMSKFSQLDLRVPQKYKNFIRKAQKTTIIYPNQKSIRVVKNNHHESFLNLHGAFYSTSANITKSHFDEVYARSVADIVEEYDGGFSELKASKIFKISKTNIKKIRV